MRGLQGLLKLLQDMKLKLAVASGSHKNEIKQILSNLGFLHHFTTYISGDEVKNSKPSPEIFIHTAAKLKMNCKDCLVLEDAPKGVQAAKAANMLCYAVPSKEVKGEDFRVADRVFKNLTEVKKYIQQSYGKA